MNDPADVEGGGIAAGWRIWRDTTPHEPHPGSPASRPAPLGQVPTTCCVRGVFPILAEQEEDTGFRWRPAQTRL